MSVGVRGGGAGDVLNQLCKTATALTEAVVTPKRLDRGGRIIETRPPPLLSLSPSSTCCTTSPRCSPSAPLSALSAYVLTLLPPYISTTNSPVWLRTARRPLLLYHTPRPRSGQEGSLQDLGFRGGGCR